ncbi:CdaR family transcriptional regulator [Paenibacillus sp. J31TS4]|uniref:PucR family transcriptional regulator n=1 Tax=Paenibacillus sp. J31TS4 TaxID=2807195 RepID=UPI001BCF691A|nr:helix-turn-helix domain-containing protein [Paenibacillus sp. J31TS4]
MARTRLEPVLEARIRPAAMAIEEWNIAAQDILTGEMSKSVASEKETLFFLEADEETAVLLAVEKSLAKGERDLVELLLETWKSESAPSEAEKAAAPVDSWLLLRNWLLDRIEQGEPYPSMPETYCDLGDFGTASIPFLIQGDFADPGGVGASELGKLLDSFFETKTVVIPLGEREWVLLGSSELLEASEAEDGESGEHESIEETLVSIGSGLLEMLDNEWVGECHLAVHMPIVPAESLVQAILTMREAVELGKAYHPGENVHFPWQLQLERLFFEIPPGAKTGFVKHVFKEAHSLDGDMIAALETFFAQNCSVSDTAKRLYIHRNTLLYRLDKFKQETGLDVRTFHDAVLVKIALLLYKVTKRA